MKILSKRARAEQEHLKTSRQVFGVDVSSMNTDRVTAYLKSIKVSPPQVTYDPVTTTDFFSINSPAGDSKVEALPPGHDFTEAQYDEREKCAADPAYFMSRYCKLYWGEMPESLMDFDKRPYLHEMVDKLQDGGKIIVKAPRQSGKTTFTLAYALWLMAFKPQQNILFASRGFVQAKDAQLQFYFMLDNLPAWLRSATVCQNRQVCQLTNESRVRFEAATPKLGRGQVIDLLILDEFAYVSPNIQKAILEILLPCLNTHSKLIISSTPSSSTDTYALLWYEAGAGHLALKRVSFSCLDLPSYTHEHIANFRKLMGEAAFRREYLCEFDSPFEKDKLSAESLPVSSFCQDDYSRFHPEERDLGMGTFEVKHLK
jgi:hypothetical protein